MTGFWTPQYDRPDAELASICLRTIAEALEAGMPLRHGASGPLTLHGYLVSAARTRMRDVPDADQALIGAVSAFADGCELAELQRADAVAVLLAASQEMRRSQGPTSCTRRPRR